MMAEIDGFMAMPDEFEENYTEMSEDCLHLQVYTSNPNPSAKLPVSLFCQFQYVFFKMFDFIHLL